MISIKKLHFGNLIWADIPTVPHRPPLLDPPLSVVAQTITTGAYPGFSEGGGVPRGGGGGEIRKRS